MSINGYSYRVRVDKERLQNKPRHHFEIDQLNSFDIPAIIKDLKSEQSWMEGELSSVILLNGPSYKVLLTLLHEGTEVISYQANDSITFQVIEGSLILHIREELVALNKGEMLTIDEKIKYSFDAVEETAFLLTLVSEKGGDQQI